MDSDRQDDDARAVGDGQEEHPVERAGERLVRRDCEWCGTPVAYSGRGRPPLYCSKSCRNRASELRTAEARLGRQLLDGRVRTGPVREVVERVVERVVEVRVEVPAARPPQDPQLAAAVVAGDVFTPPATAREWAQMLHMLAAELDNPRSPLRRRHFDHRHIYRALGDALAALRDAHPGGFDALDKNR